MTASGSLYAGFQVFAKQVKAKARNGIVPQWDLRGKLRVPKNEYDMWADFRRRVLEPSLKVLNRETDLAGLAPRLRC